MPVPTMNVTNLLVEAIVEGETKYRCAEFSGDSPDIETYVLTRSQAVEVVDDLLNCSIKGVVNNYAEKIDE